MSKKEEHINLITGYRVKPLSDNEFHASYRGLRERSYKKYNRLYLNTLNGHKIDLTDEEN